MAVFIDVKSRFDDASGRKAAEEAKRYFDNAGTSSGDGFMGNFARAVEKDSKVRAAADKVANQLDKITAAEAKRATQVEKSKAITEATAAAEKKLADARNAGDSNAALAAEKQLTSLREKQVEVDNKLVVSAANVSRAQRDKARAVRDASAAYRDMGNDVDGLSDKLAKLGSAGGAIKLNLGLAALGTLPAAATGIAEVAGALQQLAGAGFAVPGIFAGIASSVGVGALGMYGMSDAIKAVSKASDGTKTSVEAANKALAGLAPAQADVVRTTVGLKGTFDDLRGISSGNMFAGVSGGIKGLVGTDLPAVTRGVDGISRAINQNLLQGIRSLGSTSSQGFLDRIFGNTAAAQSKLTAAIDPAINAIGTLTAAGTDSLPRLADAVGNVADRFNRFITTADANGSLAKWIDDGLTGFSQLGNAALNIGKSFGAITEAAGGGTGLLGTLESATGRMTAFLNSTEGQTKLREYFAEGRDMLGQLRDVATSAGPVLAGVFQAGIGAANLWLPVIKDVLDTINEIPGGAAAVVGAFATWQTITGIASVAKSLNTVADLLKLALPAAAADGAKGISAAFGGLFAAGGIFAKMLPFMKFAGSVGIGMGGVQPEIGGGTGYSDTERLQLMKDHPEFSDPSKLEKWIADHPKGTGNYAPGYGASVSPDWKPVLDPTAARPGTYRRRDGTIGTIPGTAAGPDATTPGVSSFTDPVITEAPKSGAAATPFIDPSKYQMGDPLKGLPGATAGADPSKIYDTDSKVITATHNLEQGRLALQVLEAKGNATQQELLTARNNLVEQERALYNAQDDAIKARTNQMKQSTSDLASVFAPLDQGFGISGGIPGIVENLTKMFGNIALAGAIAQSPSLQAGAAQLAANGGVAPGLFNQQYFTGSGSPATGSAGYAGTAGDGAYPGDAALLANVPRGIGHYDNGTKDLSKGLVDCASGVEDLVNIMDGKSTAGGSLWTGNASSVLPGMGFQRGMGGPGDFRIGYNDHHMQATLPGGSNVNYGSTPAIQAGGLDGGQGAFDPAFTDHWYRPAGGSYAPVGGAGATSVPASAGLASGGGTQSVFVVNMPGGGFLPTGGGGVGAPGGPAPADPFATGPGAAPSTIGPAPLGGGAGAPTPMGWGGGGLPSIPAGAGGQGYGIGAPAPGVAGQAAGAGIGSTGVSPAASGGPGGIGVNEGLVSAAGSAADLIAPGSSVALKVANRSIQFAGQAAAIGVQGAIDTVLPASTPLAANSWFSKLIGGVSGAKPAKPNTAGGQGGNPQQAPQMAGAGGGQGGPPQKAGDTNIHVDGTNQSDNSLANTIAWHNQQANQGPGN